MAEEDPKASSNGHDSGSKDRATVALVDAKVDGLKDLIRAEFGYIRDKIEPMTSLVVGQERLKTKVADHEDRISDIEEGARDKAKADRDWKRDRLPSLIIAGVVAIGSIVALLTHGL